MAAEPKTRPTDASVADFIAAIEPPRRREEAETVRALMAEATGQPAVLWGPSIVGFGSCRMKTGDWPLIAFSPRKANLVLYLESAFDGRDALIARLGPVKTSVACVYAARLDKLDAAVLRQLIEQSVAASRARYPD